MLALAKLIFLSVLAPEYHSEAYSKLSRRHPPQVYPEQQYELVAMADDTNEEIPPWTLFLFSYKPRGLNTVFIQFIPETTAKLL